MKNKLHPTQKKLLDLLAKNVNNPLTIRELQRLVDVSSTSIISHHLNQLEKRGYLKRNTSNPKDYHVLSGNPEKPIAYVGVYGLGQCGPSGSLLDGNPEERIPVSTRIIDFPVSEAFMVRAKGDSMEPTIFEGDLIVARKNSLLSENNKKTVVCVNNEETLVKKMIYENNRVILTSNNPKYTPFIASDDFRVEGVVRSVIFHKIK